MNKTLIPRFITSYSPWFHSFLRARARAGITQANWRVFGAAPHDAPENTHIPISRWNIRHGSLSAWHTIITIIDGALAINAYIDH